MNTSAARRRFASRVGQALLLLGIASPELGAGDPPLRVAVTIPPQAWLVERIGGEAVDVLVVVGAGESPATFQPTDAQITGLSRVALYFRIGVPVERGSACRPRSPERAIDQGVFR